MCTAISYRGNGHYFGRTLDLECSIGEHVVIVPRGIPLPMRNGNTLRQHHAMIGMGFVADGYPLLYDAMNEQGLCIAGLNFPDNAFYFPPSDTDLDIASFELIPYILATCKTVKDARAVLQTIQITDTAFSPSFPPSPLHWIIADHSEAITVESVSDGIHIYDNEVGVLTNNPPFPFQMTNLCSYRGLSPTTPENTFSRTLSLIPYSRGMGALGLPGDCSSPSRFVRAAFTKENATVGNSKQDDIQQFFHILGTVEHVRGCVKTGNGQDEITVYTSCCDTDTGIYYYTTYQNRHICGVDMFREDLDGDTPIAYPLINEDPILIQNA